MLLTILEAWAFMSACASLGAGLTVIVAVIRNRPSVTSYLAAALFSAAVGLTLILIHGVPSQW
jgi:hypothetical protein